MVSDRYSTFLINNKATIVPFIKLDKKPTDRYEVYKQGISLLDIISFNNYGSSEYVYILKMANAEFGFDEFDYQDEVYLRVPYPLEVTLNEYSDKVSDYFKY